MAKYSKIIFLTTCVSLLISIYNELTRRKLEADKDYTPFCDYGKYLCSDFLKSNYSIGFGFNFLPEALKYSSSLYAIAFYTIVASLSKIIELYTHHHTLTLFFSLLGFSKNIIVVEFQLFLSSLSIWMSIYLAYVLIYIIKNICINCISLYVLNVITIIFIAKKYRYSLKMRKTKTF